MQVQECTTAMGNTLSHLVYYHNNMNSTTHEKTRRERESSSTVREHFLPTIIGVHRSATIVGVIGYVGDRFKCAVLMRLMLHHKIQYKCIYREILLEVLLSGKNHHLFCEIVQGKK